MKKLTIIFLCTISALFSSCFSIGGLIDPSVPDSHYIEYAKNFHYVGKIYGLNMNSKDYFGSCVAITDNVVLTAAHIVQEMKTAKVLINNKQINVIKSIAHQDFRIDKLGHNDIAICFLEESIGLEWYPSLYTNKNEINKLCCLSGYGAYGTFFSGPTKTDNQRRAGSNYIDYTELGVLICTPSTDNTKTALEFLICPGDSGGGLFIDNKLAGIHSYVLTFKPSKKQESAHTRISDHVEWIEKHKKLIIQEGK